MTSNLSSVVFTNKLRVFADKVCKNSTDDEAVKFKKWYDFNGHGDTIEFSRVKKLHELLLKVEESPPHLHELLEGSELHLPSPPPRARNPELEKRLEKLRKEQENMEYRHMTRNLGYGNKDDLAQDFKKDIRMLNTQLIYIFNFVLTVVAAFACGYFAPRFLLGVTDVASCVMIGLVVATCVFFADLYFLVRTFD